MSDKPKAPKVKPTLNEDEQRHKLFTGLTIRSLAQLSGYLDKNSTLNSQHIYPPNIANAKHFVISGMLDEVEKSAISLLETASFIDESNKSGGTQSEETKQQIEEMKDVLPGLEGNIYQSKIDELTLWERKLTEQTVDLVGFRHIKKDGYYRHYVILREIEKLKKLKSDFLEYYGADTKNIQFQIDELKSNADRIASTLDLDKCFYVQNANAKNGDRFKIANFKDRLNRTLPWMTASEKIMVGQTYIQYSEQSSSLHPGIAQLKESKRDMKEVDNHFMRVALLESTVIFTAKDCLNIHNINGDLANYHRAMKQNDYPKKLMAESTKSEIEKGDYVIAYSDLAQVTKVIKSKFGYRSFRVRYLERAPIPELGDQEEMPARYVFLYQKRAAVATEVIKLLEDGSGKKPNMQRVNNSITKQILELWNEAGGKERANGDIPASQKKLAEYIEKQKKEMAAILQKQPKQ